MRLNLTRVYESKGSQPLRYASYESLGMFSSFATTPAARSSIRLELKQVEEYLALEPEDINVMLLQESLYMRLGDWVNVKGMTTFALIRYDIKLYGLVSCSFLIVNKLLFSHFSHSSVVFGQIFNLIGKVGSSLCAMPASRKNGLVYPIPANLSKSEEDELLVESHIRSTDCENILRFRALIGKQSY